MWEVLNGTDFAADRLIVVDKDGAQHYVVVVKGTFDILADGTTKPAEEQLPPLFAPEYREEPGTSSLLYDQDFTLPKPGTDVVVNGTAYAPGGQPQAVVTVGLKTPNGTKNLVVRGDRVYSATDMSRPIPFSNMPVIYERAFGGYDQTGDDPTQHLLDPRNPVGTGTFAKRAHRVGQPVANIEFAGKSADAGPAGFGALCSHWRPRTDFQGTYDAAWVKTRKPLLPADWDPRTLQCAPLDQQFSPHLRGGEIFGLVNMTPDGALQFALPKHYFKMTTKIGGRNPTSKEHRTKIHTVIIEPDHPRVMVVWHSILSCHHQIDDIDSTTVKELEYV